MSGGIRMGRIDGQTARIRIVLNATVIAIIGLSVAGPVSSATVGRAGTHRHGRAARRAASHRVAPVIGSRWTLTGSVSVPRYFASAVTLQNGMVLVAGRMLTVYDLRLGDHDTPFLTKPLHDLATDFRFVPVHWQSNDRPRTIERHKILAPGDRLTVIIALDDLQRLANVQRV